MRSQKFIFLFVIFVGIFSCFSQALADSPTMVADDITYDTIWTQKESPYIVYFPIMVAKGVTLSIEPGVVVKFDKDCYLMVDGNLKTEDKNENPIYFTSLADDSVGGDTNLDGSATTPTAGDWGGVSFFNKTNSLAIQNMHMAYASRGLLFFGANAVLNNFSITDIPGNAIALYEGSVLTGDTISIHNITNDVAIIAMDASNATIKNLNIEGVFGAGAIYLYDKSNFSITDSSIKNIQNGWGGAVSIFGASLNAVNTVFEDGAHDGIAVYGGSALTLDHSIVSLFTDAGISDYSDDYSDMDKLNIKNSAIERNDTGFSFYGSNTAYSISENTINNNNNLGAESYASATISLKNNYWGDASGPQHDPDNFFGRGNGVFYIPDYEKIVFTPWLHYDPLHPGPSNVLFIPGFQGSRMYNIKYIPIIGDVEDKLWEPNANSDVVNMSMDENGVSLNNKIYTRDVIDEKNVLGFSGGNLYKSFMDDLNAMVTDGVIADWRAVPYDWRLLPGDVVNRGILREDGTISYNEELTDDQVPFIIDQLQKLADSSKDGKVTIVTHSNGGLVAKALIKKLTEMKNTGQGDLLDCVDRLIMVAAPQMGTPKAVAGLLHGYDQGIFGGILLKQSVARKFGINVPGAYSLLPSESYFAKLKNYPVIFFDKSVDLAIPNFRQEYGESIDSFAEFNDFLLGTKDGRFPPPENDVIHPVNLNQKLLAKSNTFHKNIDADILPDTLKVYQVAGWGLPTLKDIRYFSEKECISLFAFKPCIPTNVFTEDFRPTVDGDKTVLSPSATYITNSNTQNYYLNIKQYVVDFDKKGVEHANIFEVPYLRTLIKNILTDISDLPNYITKEKPKDSQNLIITVPKKIAKVVVTSKKDNKKTGDKIKSQPPNPSSEFMDSDFDKIDEEIPGSSYSVLGGRGYIIVPAGGSYAVSVFGVPDSSSAENPDSNFETVSGAGIITIREDVMENDQVTSTTFFPNVPITPTTQVEFTTEENTGAGNLLVDAGGDGVFESSVAPIVVPNPDPVGNPDGPIDIPEELRPPVDDGVVVDSNPPAPPANNPSGGGSMLKIPVLVNNIISNVPTNTINNQNPNLKSVITNENLGQDKKTISSNFPESLIKKDISLETNNNPVNLLTASAGSAGQSSNWRLIIVSFVGIVGLALVVRYVFRVK